MKYNPHIHHRQSIRLRGFDYSDVGGYFVTVCTHGKERLFGLIIDDIMSLNDSGRVVETVWKELPNRFPRAVIDEFIVMPNHFHGIIMIGPASGTKDGTPRDETDTSAMEKGAMVTGAMNRGGAMNQEEGAMNRAPTGDGCNFVGARFIAPSHTAPPNIPKTSITPGLGEIIRTFKAVSTRLIRKEHMPEFTWQRNYYERIIRNEAELAGIREYIAGNPTRWAEDPENQESNPQRLFP